MRSWGLAPGCHESALSALNTYPANVSIGRDADPTIPLGTPAFAWATAGTGLSRLTTGRLLSIPCGSPLPRGPHLLTIGCQYSLLRARAGSRLRSRRRSSPWRRRRSEERRVGKGWAARVV